MQERKEEEMSMDFTKKLKQHAKASMIIAGTTMGVSAMGDYGEHAMPIVSKTAKAYASLAPMDMMLDMVPKKLKKW